MPKTMYTTAELAEVLGVSRQTVYKRIRQPGFPMVRCGKQILIPIRAFEVWRRDQYLRIMRGETEHEKTGGSTGR